MLQIKRIFAFPQAIGTRFCSSLAVTVPKKEDELFKQIELELRGHDKQVIHSYCEFLKQACTHLEIRRSEMRRFPYIKWIQYALRAKFAKKKYKLHYETRTHIVQMDVYELTGSTARTFLEYIQRNIPEGVAMKVTYQQLCRLPFKE